MKLLYCEHCNDVFNLTEKIKKCSCKKSFGSIKDGTAYYGGESAQVLSLAELLLQQIADPEAIKIEADKKKKIEDQNIITAAKVIRYLNEKAGTGYLDNFKKAPAHFKIIIARIDEGFVYQDFINVIDKKCEHWLHNEQMFHNLRPSTLFSQSNFPNYIGELKNARSKEIAEQPVGNNPQGTSFDKFSRSVEAAKEISFSTGRENR